MGKVIIIAEAGVNHNGSIDMAIELIHAAAAAGADYVKFQTFKAEKLVSKNARKADYQLLNDPSGDHSQFDMLKKLELTDEMHITLTEYCLEEGIGFLSSAFDPESIDFLDSIGMNLFKIPSGEITNKPYLQCIAKKGKPVIMSTGMSDMQEIETALDILVNEGLNRNAITVLHCNTQYPTPYKDVNLKAMLSIKEELNVKIGYSDHTEGIEVPIAAVALGAEVIEKHFTLNRNLPGPDHKASIEPDELKKMISSIRNIELAISGDGLKKISESEAGNKSLVRKSIHLSCSLPKGTILQSNHLTMKRPGDGISPIDIDNVIGRELLSDLPEDHKLTWDELV